MFKYSADLEGGSSNFSSWLTSWNWASFCIMRILDHIHDSQPVAAFKTSCYGECGWLTACSYCPCESEATFILGCTQPVTEHGRGPGVGPVRGFLSWAGLAQGLPFSWPGLHFSLRLFLSNPSFSISFPGLAPWCEGIPCLLLPIFHLTFVEITLNTSFAHVILSLSSATQRTRTDNFYLEWEGQENVSKGLEIPSSIRDVFRL